MSKKSISFNRKIKKITLSCLISGLVLGGLFTISGNHFNNANSNPVHASRISAYDVSQWQGYISNHQAKQLHHEVHFMILRGEYGSRMQDAQLRHNVQVLNHNHIPFGVYDYSIYHNAHQAKQEARNLYYRTPNAKFYVNDAEENDAGGRFNNATQAWGRTMKHISHKPIILYSDLAFMNEHTTHATRHTYNAIWLAAYSRYQPRTSYHYDLWQFASTYKSHALRQRVDADIIPKGSKPLSFWTGKNDKKHTVVRRIRKAPKHVHFAKKVARIPKPRRTQSTYQNTPQENNQAFSTQMVYFD